MNKNENKKFESWKRDSINAWGYELSRMGQFEQWKIIAHKVGTAGNMDTYCLATQVHDLRTNDWEINPNPNYIFTGVNAREEVYEFAGL